MNWGVAKHLRIIERGIRESVEGSRRQTNNLQTIENSIHNMRQIAAGDVGNTRVDEPTGDEIVDTELELLRKRTHGENTFVSCPRCGKQMMEQYLKMHVKQCRFEARVDIYGDEATALEKGARADTSKVSTK